jgi:hypothetical protein
MGYEVGVGEDVMVTSGSFMPSPEPVVRPMSRVLRTGLTGLPLTSAAHRLSLNPNDPEVTITSSPTLTSAPGR